MKKLFIVCTLVGLMGCASVPTKQKVSEAHSAFRQSVIALDEAEADLCVPKVDHTNQCTSTVAATVGLTDAKHQKFRAALAKVYAIDAKASAAIIGWKAGDPVPADVQALLTDAQEALTVATDIGYGPLVTKAQALVVRVQAVVDLLNGFNSK